MAQPANNLFETWTAAGVPGTSNGTCTNWTAYSENGGTFTRHTASFFRTYNAEIRSSAAAPTNSIGGCVSDSFALANDNITFFHQSSNVNVAINFYLLDASDDSVLINQSITPNTLWTQEIIDVSLYSGMNVKIKFTQHTTQAGSGHTTYIDDIHATDTLSYYPPDFSATYVKSTTNAGSGHLAFYAAHPGTSLIDAWDNNNWLASATTNQRFHIDLGTARIINKIYYENDHNSGASTDVGAKNFTLWGSNSATAFAELTYGTDTDWTQLTTDVSQFVQHTGSNVADPRYVVVTNTTAYRYYAIKIADNWGNGANLGLRRIELQYVVPPPVQKTLSSDAKIKVLGVQKTLTSDALISPPFATILSDAKIKALNVQETILSDAKVVDQYQETILSDAKILAIGVQKNILSDARIVIEVLYNINNKINTVIRVLSNINNKVNTAKRVLSNINNFINTCKSVLYDINNDIRTKGTGLYNVTNDIRFLASFQVASDNSFQSLGKGYIKVYIATVEQTDVDVDSINISKGLNSAHTASFSLGRAYDSTKPAIESVVEIKYHIWTLFKGYITGISPSDSPESMRIECQNEHWKQNQTNVHFQVGQKPIQSDDLFYDTIKNAISTEYSWNLSFGNFVPETINCNNIGKSDALNNLITDMGNFGWFYDVDVTKKLWIAGEGNIINIERQALGNNIKLYDLISHQFSEDVSELVNQYRVQMGEKVINQTRTVAQYHNYRQVLTPAWDAAYEVLAKDSIDGEGVDSHSPENASLFAEVFKKYNMPFLDSSLSSWSDINPPRLEIYSINSQAFGFVGELGLDYVMTLTEGFTIDYDKKTITLTEPLFLYQTDGNGEITAIRAPIIKAFLWQKNYYTYSSSVSNPLEFDTPVMGSYPVTIKKDLELSGLTIQDSQRYIYYKGIQYYVAPYDDTQYALDIANWNLSKVCDKRITGNIEITLDAMCFYNINLTNRIYIAGITDAPMNIQSISYDMNNFTVRLQLQNSRAYTRTVSLPYRGEE